MDKEVEFVKLKRMADDIKGSFNVFVACGEDSYFRKEAGNFFLKLFVTEPSLNFTSFSGEDVLSNPQEFFSSLSVYPFMSEKRLVKITEFYPKKAFFDTIINEYLPTDSPTVLFIDNQKKCDVLSKSQRVFTVDCKKASDNTVAEWITAYAKREEVKVSFCVALKIARYSLCDMTKVKNETDKLISYSKDEGEITDYAVETVCNKEVEYQIYNMTECIAKKDFGGALKIVDDMIKKGEPPQKLTVSIYYFFRKLLYLSLSNDDKEAGEMLGLQGYAFKVNKELSSKFKKKSLKKAVDFLVKCDYGAKTGGLSFDESLFLSVFKTMIG